MSRLNHNRPIASGDILGAENQRLYQNGSKFPPIAPGCILDLGCQFSDEALRLRDTLSRREIRKMRMERQMAAQKADLTKKRKLEIKDAHDELCADFFEKETSV